MDHGHLSLERSRFSYNRPDSYETTEQMVAVSNFRDDMANIRLVVVFNKKQSENAKHSRQGILRKTFTSSDVIRTPTKVILRMGLSIKQQSTFDESALPPAL